MAADSPVFATLRHPIPTTSCSSSPSRSTASFPGTEPRLPASDPLQGLIQEMALSAVIQKHSSSVSAPPTAPSPHTNGTIIKNYIIQPPTSSGPPFSESPVQPPPSTIASLTQQNHTAQGPSVVLAPSNMQQGFITLSATASQASGGVSLLQAHQPSPVIQGAPLTLPQFQEVATANPTNMVQLTPVCYGSTQTPLPSPAVDRSAVLQQQNIVG